MTFFEKLLLALLLGAPGWLLAQQDPPSLQYDIAFGLHSYYMPFWVSKFHHFNKSS
ncbi:MAG: hypothetical protein H6573_26065 [Lewinellaceae bacterium]|nr:hypothetical protein [Phaeodactylibacter sp.]MCB0615009.1 hypothetical protein [Phaeodactylibacter sp.]MCB9350942.1 hypothetical protein [Lewinellaceae bacterium]